MGHRGEVRELRQSLVRFYDATLGRPSGRNRRLLEESLRAICRDLEALEASVSLREMSRDLEALRATVALYSTVQFRLPLPPMGGWAIGPDFACELVREIIRRRPRAILELGTGASTLVSGYALEMGGGGKIVSVEHQMEYSSLSALNIKDHQLGDTAQVIHAPLKDVVIGGETFPWYDPSCFPQDRLFDMLIVDGPPGHLRPLARFPALPMLMKALTPDAIIVLDDANRPDEVSIIDRWDREYGPFAVELRSTRTGMAILRRGEGEASSDASLGS